MFVIDCNPSFAIYTQLALVAADFVVVPFTGDDSSRRAVENVVALLYGYGDAHTAAYASISFSKRALAEGLDIPLLHTFISNRQTLFDGRPTKAFEAVNSVIQKTVDEIFAKHRNIFANKKQKPSEGFLEVPGLSRSFYCGCDDRYTTSCSKSRSEGLGRRASANKS